MSSHIEKEQNSNVRLNTNITKSEQQSSSQRSSSASVAQQAANSSSYVTQLQAMQQMANSSPYVTQLNAMQQKANNSPAVQQGAQQQAMADKYTSSQHPIQKKENNTGLPDNLKSGIENLSGYAMDDVKVHRNSDKPAQMQAHAYAQGTDIHLAPGQEKHLPHEAWHVVQQKQGRVKPTMQMKDKVNINDDAGLEKEADVMGARAIQPGIKVNPDQLNKIDITNQSSVLQGHVFGNSKIYRDQGNLKNALCKDLEEYIEKTSLPVIAEKLSIHLLDKGKTKDQAYDYSGDEESINLRDIEAIVKQVYEEQNNNKLKKHHYEHVLEGIEKHYHKVYSNEQNDEKEVLEEIEGNGEINQSSINKMLALIDKPQSKDDARNIAARVEKEAAMSRKNAQSTGDENQVQTSNRAIVKWIGDPGTFNSNKVREAKKRENIPPYYIKLLDEVKYMIDLHNQQTAKNDKIVYRIQKYKINEHVPYTNLNVQKEENSIKTGDYITNRGFWSTSQHRRFVLGEVDDDVVAFDKDRTDYEDKPMSVVKMVIHTKKGMPIGGVYKEEAYKHSNHYIDQRPKETFSQYEGSSERVEKIKLQLENIKNAIQMQTDKPKNLFGFGRQGRIKKLNFQLEKLSDKLKKEEKTKEICERKVNGTLNAPGQAEILLDTHSYFKVLQIQEGDKGKKYADYKVVLQQVDEGEVKDKEVKDSFTGKVF